MLFCFCIVVVVVDSVPAVNTPLSAVSARSLLIFYREQLPPRRRIAQTCGGAALDKLHRSFSFVLSSFNQPMTMDTSKVTNMDRMFDGATAMTHPKPSL